MSLREFRSAGSDIWVSCLAKSDEERLVGVYIRESSGAARVRRAALANVLSSPISAVISCAGFITPRLSAHLPVLDIHLSALRESEDVPRRTRPEGARDKASQLGAVD